jgi:uncharacterized membrane protein
MSTAEKALTETGDAKTPQRSAANQNKVNVGGYERYASAVGGGALALYGLSRKSVPGLLLAGLGGALLYRGTTGHCKAYGALGIDTAKGKSGSAKGLLGGRGTRVVKSITINRPRAELFDFWRNFDNLPRVISHLASVTVTNDKRSHWKAKAPAGMSVEWDAEILRERENRLIAWRSLEGADVENAGTVRFERMPQQQTQIVVAIEYIPPGGVLGVGVAKLFGEDPERQLEEDLNRFKEMVERGEVALRAPAPNSSEVRNDDPLRADAASV